MPAYDVKAAYSIDIAATPQRVWEELLHADFTNMPIARRLMKLRSLGRRKPASGAPRTLATMGSDRAGGFHEISRVPEQEIVLAIVGKFWLPQRDETLVQVRLYGKSVVTIDHQDYLVNGETNSATPATARQTVAWGKGDAN